MPLVSRCHLIFCYWHNTWVNSILIILVSKTSCSEKIKNMMEYLKTYHLLKWNPQNKFIIQQPCVESKGNIWFRV